MPQTSVGRLEKRAFLSPTGLKGVPISNSDETLFSFLALAQALSEGNGLILLDFSTESHMLLNENDLCTLPIEGLRVKVQSCKTTDAFSVMEGKWRGVMTICTIIHKRL